jgi:hypothetical protein
MPGPWGINPAFSSAAVATRFLTPFKDPAQDGTNNVAAPGPLGTEEQLMMSQSLVLRGSTSPGAAVLLDMAQMRDVFVMPSASTSSTNSTTGAASNASSTDASPPVTLTLANLTLFNLPTGAPEHYPLGMSSLLMWSVNMDR